MRLRRTVVASEAHIGEVGGRSAVIETSYTRPADTAQYTANDALSNSTSAPTVLTFSGCGRVNGGSGIVQSIEIISSANQGTLPQLRLFLFDATPTPINDNAPFTITDAEHTDKLPGGSQDFTTWLTGASGGGAAGNVSSDLIGLGLPFKCGADNKNLFGLIQVRNTYTPISGEVITVRLGILQD